MIKPCPFCGRNMKKFEPVDYFKQGSSYRWRLIMCPECGACGPEERIKTYGDGTNEEWEAACLEKAIAAWNERKEP